MDKHDQEFSQAIHRHVKAIAHSTRLAGKLDRGKVDIAGSPETPERIIHMQTDPEVYLEVNDSLFFFYGPATIVRWPKPVTGETKSFQIVLCSTALPEGVLKNTDLMPLADVGEEFTGEFTIDKDGNLYIHCDGHPVDIVALGNPGSELGVNTKC